MFVFVFYALLCAHSGFAIILKRKRELIALQLLSYRYFDTMGVLRLFHAVLSVGLRCVIVVFLIVLTYFSMKILKIEECLCWYVLFTMPPWTFSYVSAFLTC